MTSTWARRPPALTSWWTCDPDSERGSQVVAVACVLVRSLAGPGLSAQASPPITFSSDRAFTLGGFKLDLIHDFDANSS